MIDVHAHLEDEAFQFDLQEVIDRAKAEGVRSIITSGLDLLGIRKGFEIYKKYRRYVFLTAGLSPAEVDNKYPEIMQLIRSIRNDIVGVGEVGLDFYLTDSEEGRNFQGKVFRDFIQLAKDLNLPIVVHSRSAGREAIQVLSECGAKRVLMHAFDGSPSEAMEGVRNGYMFSIPASVVRSSQKQRLVEVLPLENIVLETDSPVLGPVVGKRNEPANIVLVARKVADIKRLTMENVVEATTGNAKRLFERMTVQQDRQGRSLPL